MKKIFAAFFLLFNFTTSAQQCNYSKGTKTLYSADQAGYTRPPAGYIPVFINHVGRHGARHLTKDVASYPAFKWLIRADSANGLKAQGKMLKQMLMALRELEIHHLKSISIQGKIEQVKIAERMVKSNPGLFASPVAVKIEVTKEIRTGETADAFLEGMTDRIRELKPEKRINDTALRFFDFSPAYLNFEKKGAWEETVQNFTSSASYKKAASAFADRIFKQSFVPADLQEFSQDIYGFVSIIPSVKKEANDSSFFALEKLLTCEELQQFAKLDQLEDYLLKGPGEDSMGIQVKIAVPLLVEFLQTTDDFIRKPSKRLALRFAHAETISPIAALMQLTEASTPSEKAIDFRKSWKPENVIPLSANIQWIIYQKTGRKDFLVKILLNEKETSIKGLTSEKYPYYDLNQVRAFYIRLLLKLGVHLETNMPAFLTNLKLN